MNDTIEIYLELSEEVRKLLAQRNTSINDVLRRADIETDIRYVESSFENTEGVTTRDVKTILIVSAVALALIEPAIVDFINVSKNDAERTSVVWYEMKPAVNPKTGDVLRDKKGELILNKIPHIELSQSYPVEEKQAVKLDIPKILSISFSSESKEISK